MSNEKFVMSFFKVEEISLNDYKEEAIFEVPKYLEKICGKRNNISSFLYKSAKSCFSNKKVSQNSLKQCERRAGVM